MTRPKLVIYTYPLYVGLLAIVCAVAWLTSPAWGLLAAGSVVTVATLAWSWLKGGSL